MNESMDPLAHIPMDAKTINVPQSLIQDLFDLKNDVSQFAFRLGIFTGERAKIAAEIAQQPDEVIVARGLALRALIGTYEGTKAGHAFLPTSVVIKDLEAIRDIR